MGRGKLVTSAHPAVRRGGVLIRLLGRPEILGVDGPLPVDSAEACTLLTRIALHPNEIVLTEHTEAADELRVLLDKADPGGDTELITERFGYRLRIDPERIDVHDPTAISAAELALLPDTLRRDLVGRQMTELHRQGRRAEALAVYERIQAGRRDQPLDPVLRALYDRILYDDPSLLPPEPSSVEIAGVVAPAQLPPAPTGFTGRHEELSSLDRLLQQDTSTLGVVVGAAGTGKTALAVTWAGQVARDFPDGQLFVCLRGYDQNRPPAEPADVLRRFLIALGVAPQAVPVDLAERAALYRSLLAGRRVLVLLDDARDSEQVRPLLPGGRGPLTIVTSRRRLDGLVARDGAAYVPVGTLPGPQAVRLLDEVSDIPWSQRDPVNASRIANLCGHLPLALRIVGARLAMAPNGALARLADELADERHRLQVLDIEEADDDMQVSVRRAFDVSYRTLPPEYASVFRLLGFFPGVNFGPHLVAAMSGGPVSAARAALRALSAAHLITETSQDWFTMHDLVRLHAREVAFAELTQAEAFAVGARVLEYYCVVSDRARRLIRPPADSLAPSLCSLVATPRLENRAHALAWFERERGNLISVLRGAHAGAFHTRVWQLARLQLDFLATHCPWEDWRTSHELGLAAAKAAGDRNGEALMHHGLGLLYGRLGEHERALAEHEACRKLAEGDGDLPVVALGSAHAASALFHLSRHDEAVALSRQALALYRLLGDRYRQAQPLSTLGELARLSGDYEASLAYNQQALHIYQQYDDQERQAWVRVHLGETNRAAGWLDHAEACFTEAVRLSRVSGTALREGYAVRGLGDVYLDRGDKHAARAVWEEALRSFGHIGTPWVASVRARLAKLFG
jgi:tetratricopeptide (TPR) repeat protein